MPATESLPRSSARAGAPCLTVSGLACRRGDRTLFNGLAFDLAPGQVLWVRGANGRGKTSLLRLLSGLSSPEQGDIRWHGAGLRAAGSDFRRHLLYIGHANALKDDLTVLEALGFLARIHGQLSTDEALAAALKTLGLHSRRAATVRTLSQGQRRRVALARLALDMAQPIEMDTTSEPASSLWVLDEPYDALDADGIAVLDGLLSARARRGGSVILTSHLPVGLRDPAPTELQLDTLSPNRVSTARRDTASAPA